MGISVQLPQEEGDFTTVSRPELAPVMKCSQNSFYQRAALPAFTAPVVCDLGPL